MSFDRSWLTDLVTSVQQSERPATIKILKNRTSHHWVKLNPPKFRYITPTTHVWNGFMPCNRPWQNPEQVDEWLIAHIGEQGNGWNRGDTGLILIPDPNHALAFRLRWC